MEGGKAALTDWKELGQRLEIWGQKSPSPVLDNVSTLYWMRFAADLEENRAKETYPRYWSERLAHQDAALKRLKTGKGAWPLVTSFLELANAYHHGLPEGNLINRVRAQWDQGLYEGAVFFSRQKLGSDSCCPQAWISSVQALCPAGPKGDALFARILIDVSTREGLLSKFQEGKLPWPRLRNGLKQVAGQWPSSAFLAESTAKLALDAGDGNFAAPYQEAKAVQLKDHAARDARVDAERRSAMGMDEAGPAIADPRVGEAEKLLAKAKAAREQAQKEASPVLLPGRQETWSEEGAGEGHARYLPVDLPRAPVQLTTWKDFGARELVAIDLDGDGRPDPCGFSPAGFEVRSGLDGHSLFKVAGAVESGSSLALAVKNGLVVLLNLNGNLQILRLERGSGAEPIRTRIGKAHAYPDQMLFTGPAGFVLPLAHDRLEWLDGTDYSRLRSQSLGYGAMGSIAADQGGIYVMDMGAERKDLRLRRWSKAAESKPDVWPLDAAEMWPASALCSGRGLVVLHQAGRLAVAEAGQPGSVRQLLFPTKEAYTVLPPAFDGRVAFVARRDGLHAVDTGSMKELWAVAMEHRPACAPVVGRKAVVCLDHAGTLMAWSLADGKALWSLPLKDLNGRGVGLSLAQGRVMVTTGSQSSFVGDIEP